MIAPIRKRHRIMIFTIAIIMAPLFILALSSRVSIGKQKMDAQLLMHADIRDFPFEIAPISFSGWEDKVDATLLGDADPPTRLALEVKLRKVIKSPSPLLYWLPGDDFREGVLLCAFPTVQGSVIELTPKVKQPNGFLVVYSMGHQTALARAVLRLERELP